MHTRRMNVALVCGLVIACGSQSRVERVAHSDGGTGGSCDPICAGSNSGGTSMAGRAGASAGGANTGGANTGGVNTGGTNTGGVNTGGANTGGANAGAGSAGQAGSGGIRVITGAPMACTTPNGSPGVVVDVFPLPEGPRPQCEALNQPGIPDSDCPSDVLLVCSIEDCYEARTLPGCCRPDGSCGLLESGYWGRDIALGCISRDPWIEHGEEVLRRPVVPVRCD